jgi:trk system potassium uptake protein TrkA
MKVVILGAGAVGMQLAKQLVDEKKDVVLIEQDADRARLASSRLDCMVINDAGNNLSVLRSAGTKDAQYFIAVTDSDEVNMIACGLVSAEFDVPYKIARVRNIDYATARIAEKSFLGIDYIVNPEIEAAQAIVRSIEHGAVSDIMLFEQAGVQMRNLSVDDESAFRGKTLEQIRNEIGIPFLVAVILRQNNYIIPSGQSEVKLGDVLYIVSTQAHFDELFGTIGKPKTDLRRIVIVGGGKIGTYVTEQLISPHKSQNTFLRRLLVSLSPTTKRSVKIVDVDYRKCKRLSQQFPDALVIHADVSEEGVLEEGYFANSDLVIATTDNQELNIVTGVYAKTFGIRRSIALVNKNNYTHIATKLGIDVPVSQKNAMVNSIMKFIRKGNIRSVHSISGGKLEVVELRVDEDSSMAGRQVRHLRLPHGSLVVSIIREGENYLPHGSEVIQAGDHVVVITRIDILERIQNLFAGVA